MKNLNLPATAKTHQWWKPKASNLLNILYLVMFMGSLPFSKSLLLLVPAVITILSIGSLGHFINDWFDIDADKRAGKVNRFAHLSAGQKRSIVAGAIVGALLPWIILPFNLFSITLLSLEFLLLLCYAIPPVRIKERTYLAVITDAAYAYAIPAVLAAHTFFLATERLYDRAFLVTLFVWQLSLGVRHFLNHLALDRINDLASDTRTLATIKGNYYLHRMIRNIILPLEVVSFASVLADLSRYSLLLVVVCFGTFIIFSSFQLTLAVGRNYSFLSYRFSNTPLDRFYQNILPFIPLIFLISRDPRFSVLLAAHFFLFYKIRPGPQMDQSSPAPLPRYFGYWPIRILVGYPVLLLRQLFYVEQESSPQPTGNSAEPAAESNAVQLIKDPSRPNIAVVNINKSKYTETFINELIRRLNYNIYYLHGGQLPLYDHEDRHFLSRLPRLQALAQFLQSVFQLDQGHFVRNSIASYLQARKIRLVLAQFGPVGVQLLPITRDLGIPLIVCFHGYDVFHQQIWNAHLLSYKALFKEAEKLLVVSEFMRERLVQSGAPLEKVIHLPAFVNLELFPYQDRSTRPPRFIAVGRFAETKSPHLTILAFKKVVEAVPDASLVMIGKGGGGELFEACLILTKALGLEDKIVFKGVISHSEVAEEMTEARVFVQHSITTPENQDMEGKPVAIMEAMSSGLPVIATRHSGISELITDEVTGLLVEEYDIEAMAEAMVLLAGNDSLVRTLGKNASGRIRNDPLVRDHINTLEGIIQECISSQG